jgi:hypothetical protein
MRKSTRMVGAAAILGIAVAGGSAFTATSTIDDAAINVGSVAQSVSGATFTNVVHTYTAATDTTTAISATAEELLSTTPGVVKVSINGGALQNCTVTSNEEAPFSNVACDITDATNVTSIRFVVNG